MGETFEGSRIHLGASLDLIQPEIDRVRVDMQLSGSLFHVQTAASERPNGEEEFLSAPWVTNSAKSTSAKHSIGR